MPKDFEDQNSYLKWIGQIIDTGKYSKKFVNMTVRAALTDSSKGPELGKLAKFLGRFQIENRLKKYTL